MTVACSVTFGFGGGGKSTSLNVISVFVALAVRLWISRVDFCMLKLSVLVTVVELYKEMIIVLVFSTIPYTDALLALSDAPLAYFGCAILLEGQKNGLSRQIDCPFLPYTSSLP